MKRVTLYDANKTYMYPNAAVATPERVAADYPATAIFPHIIETDSSGQVIYAIQNFFAAKDLYQIDSGLTDEQAIKAIQAAVNKPIEDKTIRAEERIAAALEFQNILL